MSATNRDRNRPTLPGLEADAGKHPEEFYRTPAFATDWLLEGPCEGFAPSSWIDAGAGDGAIAARLAARYTHARGVAVELDARRADACRALLAPRVEVYQGDVFTWVRGLAASAGRFQLAVTNPPFSLALAFARELVRWSERVALLQRVGWLEGSPVSKKAEIRDRDRFLREQNPGIAVISKRLGFRGEGGGTDSAAYAWILFGEGWRGRSWRLPVRAGSAVKEGE